MQHMQQAAVRNWPSRRRWLCRPLPVSRLRMSSSSGWASASRAVFVAFAVSAVSTRTALNQRGSHVALGDALMPAAAADRTALCQSMTTATTMTTTTMSTYMTRDRLVLIEWPRCHRRLQSAVDSATLQCTPHLTLLLPCRRCALAWSTRYHTYKQTRVPLAVGFQGPMRLTETSKRGTTTRMATEYSISTMNFLLHSLFVHRGVLRRGDGLVSTPASRRAERLFEVGGPGRTRSTQPSAGCKIETLNARARHMMHIRLGDTCTLYKGVYCYSLH